MADAPGRPPLKKTAEAIPGRRRANCYVVSVSSSFVFLRCRPGMNQVKNKVSKAIRILSNKEYDGIVAESCFVTFR